MNDDQQTTPAVDPNAGQNAAAPVQPPVDVAPIDEVAKEVTPNQAIVEDALNNAPLTPAAPADTAVDTAMPPLAAPDPAAPAVADPAVPATPAPAAPVEDDSVNTADPQAPTL